jgi:hypothetical protein
MAKHPSMNALVDFVKCHVEQHILVDTTPNYELTRQRENSQYVDNQRHGFNFLVTRLVVQRAFSMRRENVLHGTAGNQHINISPAELAFLHRAARSTWHVACRQFELNENVDEWDAGRSSDGVVQAQDTERSTSLYVRLGGIYPLAVFVHRAVETLLRAENWPRCGAVIVDGRVHTGSLLKYALTELVVCAVGARSLCTAIFEKVRPLLSLRQLTCFLKAAKDASECFKSSFSRDELLERLCMSRPLILGDLIECVSSPIVASGSVAEEDVDAIGAVTAAPKVTGMCTETERLVPRFPASLDDGRLNIVIVAAQRKETWEARQHMKVVTPASFFGDDLKKEPGSMRRQVALEVARKTAKATLQASLFDGRLAAAIVANLGIVQSAGAHQERLHRNEQTTPEEPEVKLEFVRPESELETICSFEASSVLVPITSEPAAARQKKERDVEAYDLEAERETMTTTLEQTLRHDARATLQSSLLDGRLAQVLMQVKDEQRRAQLDFVQRREDTTKSIVQEPLSIVYVAAKQLGSSSQTPTNGSTSPNRCFLPEPVARSKPVVVARTDPLPPKLPKSSSTAPCRSKISRKAVTIERATTFGMNSGDEINAGSFTPLESDMTHGHEARNVDIHCYHNELRPASPVVGLPAVRPPSRQACRRMVPSAISADLGEGRGALMSLDPSARLPPLRPPSPQVFSSCKVACPGIPLDTHDKLVQSAMALDLGLHDLGLAPSHATSPVPHDSATSGVVDSSKRLPCQPVPKNSRERRRPRPVALSPLPKLKGAESFTGKMNGHKRSASVGPFMLDACLARSSMAIAVDGICVECSMKGHKRSCISYIRWKVRALQACITP